MVLETRMLHGRDVVEKSIVSSTCELCDNRMANATQIKQHSCHIARLRENLRGLSNTHAAWQVCREEVITSATLY